MFVLLSECLHVLRILSIQVDIFALGISLYEVMTLRKLPPEGAYLDFNFDIAAGRRPEFVPEVRVYITICRN